MKDLYEILGVSKTATQAQIRAAYRDLAKKYHPDRNDDEATAVLFQEVKEAYDVLGNEDRRKLYDKYGDLAKNPNFKGFEDASSHFDSQFGGFDSFFRDFTAHGTQEYQGSEGVEGRSGAGEQKSTRQNSGNWNSRVYSGQTFTDRFNQGAREQDAQFKKAQQSRRSNYDPFSDFGYGQNSSRARTSYTSEEKGSDIQMKLKIELLEAVRGAEKFITVKRPTRWVSREAQTNHRPRMEEERVRLVIPSGVLSGEEFRLNKKGNPGKAGGPHGDLVVHIEVLPHAFLFREGADLFLNVPINIKEALEGASIVVPTLETSVRVRIPPGVTNGQKLRLRGRGVKKKEGGAGDLYLILRPVLPQVEDKEVQEKIKALAEQLEAYYPPEGVRKSLKL
ncbi:MAG: hypothetical protein CMK59_14460 [Proteobacteria bacterium]|nr:hypothetical protein [Pseudomonadota bacterium]